MDEPTNHLDTDAIEWLEEHLDGLDASVLLVSHDRWFLESVATGVLEIDRGRGRYDKGSYSHWRALKAERLSARRTPSSASRTSSPTCSGSSTASGTAPRAARRRAS